MNPEEFRSRPDFGIGLTDLAKAVHAIDADFPAGSFDVAGFMARIVAVKPCLVAFNGFAAARAFLVTKKGDRPCLVQRAQLENSASEPNGRMPQIRNLPVE